MSEQQTEMIFRDGSSIDHAFRALPDGAGSEVADALRRIEIAETELQRAGATGPGSSPAFMRCRPDGPLRGKGEQVYRAHCREVAARHVAGECLEPGTGAEVLCALLDAALRAPLNTEAMALADHLWPLVMGEPLPGHAARESWPGQVAEDLAVARKKIAAARRSTGGDRMTQRAEVIQAAREFIAASCGQEPDEALVSIREALRNICGVLKGDARERVAGHLNAAEWEALGELIRNPPPVPKDIVDAVREDAPAESGYPPEKVRELLDAIASNRWHAIFDLAAELRATEAE